MMDEILQTIRQSATDIADQFTDPDDDWMPVAFFEMGDGTVVPMGGDLMRNKELFVSVIMPMTIQKLHAQSVALIVSAWVITSDTPDPDVPPSQHPDRIEVVLLTHVTADETEAWRAYIDRDPLGLRPPRLGEWDHWEDEGGVIGGRFVDSIQEALREEREGS